MKKSLLAIASAMLVGVSAMTGATLDVSTLENTVANAPMRAATEDGYDLKFCGNLTSWQTLSSESNMTYKAYIYITPDVATKLAGNALTEVSFSVAFTGTAKSRPANVFVTEDIDGEPIATKDLTAENNYNAASDINTAAFDEPYIIKEGQGFYYGYSVSGCGSKDYPIGIDGSAANSFAGSVNIYNASGELKGTVDAATTIGKNIYLIATTVGDKKELNNLISIRLNNVNFELPTVEAGGTLEPKIFITNLGSNKIKGIDYKLDNGAGEITEGSLMVNVNSLKTTSYKVPVKNIADGYRNAKITVTVVNDEEVSMDATCAYIGVQGQGYPRKFVVEEGTGTWCGWCPRGIVGLETMEEKYPDTFIGIAVHSGDKFETASYTPLINKFFEGFPSCIVNRDNNFNLDPSATALESGYKKWQNQYGVAKIEITEALKADDEKTVSVTTNTTFAFNEEDAQYRLAFVVLEDGLTASQSNYYAGGGSGAMGGWEKKGSSVAWTYTNTARNIYDCWGLEESVPASIQEGQPIEFTYEVPMTGIKKVDNTIIVVLLLDARTGVVLNAEKVSAANYTTGIQDIESDDNAPAEYYNIQGMHMDANNLPAGLYIIKRGDKVTKSVIR